jgi:hypothetical protein
MQAACVVKQAFGSTSVDVERRIAVKVSVQRIG